MIPSLSPHLDIKEDRLSFLIEPPNGDYTIAFDEQNKRLTYLGVGKQVLGIGYLRNDPLLFEGYKQALKALMELAEMSPEHNDLAYYIWWAWFRKVVWDMQYEGSYKDPEIAKLNEDYIIKLAPDMEEIKTGGNPAPPAHLEEAGIIGFFDWVRPISRYKVIFENTLGYEIHGIDAILHDQETDRLIMVELKGTSRPIKRPLYYLKKTRHKGRQLSWEWVFKSLLQSHQTMASSSVFLHCLEPLFSDKIDRWLVVSRANKKNGHWVNQDLKIYKEAVLQEYAQLQEGYDFKKYKAHYQELKMMGLLDQLP